MSIINDALKKVQNQLDKQDTPSNPQPNTGTPHMENQNPAAPNTPNPNNNQKDLSQFLPQKEKPAETNAPVILSETIKPAKPIKLKVGDAKDGPKIAWSQIFSAIISLAIIAGAGYYIYMYVTTEAMKKSAPRIIPKKIQVSLPTPQEIKEAILPAPAPAAPVKKEGIALNGIVASGDRFAALINDQIYEVGDVVDGKEITSITERAVELKGPDGIKTLTLK